jgi:hypothetical protein
MSKQNQILIVGAGLSTLTLCQSHIYAERLFFNSSQKQELVLRGQLHDEQQRLYDIWIVPGYAVPLRHVQTRLA